MELEAFCNEFDREFIPAATGDGDLTLKEKTHKLALEKKYLMQQVRDSSTGALSLKDVVKTVPHFSFRAAHNYAMEHLRDRVEEDLDDLEHSFEGVRDHVDLVHDFFRAIHKKDLDILKRILDMPEFYSALTDDISGRNMFGEALKVSPKVVLDFFVDDSVERKGWGLLKDVLHFTTGGSYQHPKLTSIAHDILALDIGEFREAVLTGALSESDEILVVVMDEAAKEGALAHLDVLLHHPKAAFINRNFKEGSHSSLLIKQVALGRHDVVEVFLHNRIIDYSNGCFILLPAIGNKDHKILDAFISRDDVRAKFEMEITFLGMEVVFREACKHLDDPSIVQKILKIRGMEVDLFIKEIGSLSLHALLTENIPLLRQLKSLGANLNLTFQNGKNILMYAIEKNKEVSIREILSDASVRDDALSQVAPHGYTVTVAAIKYAKPSIFKLLIESGAPLTPNTIHALVKSNRSDLMPIAMASGHNLGINAVNASGMTPLMEAILHGFSSSTSAILKFPDVEVNYISIYGTSAMSLAYNKRDKHLMAALKASGGNEKLALKAHSLIRNKRLISKIKKIAGEVAASDELPRGSTLHVDYWQEAIMDKHYFTSDISNLFKVWKEKSDGLPFEVWISRNYSEVLSQTRVRKVQYLGAGQRDIFRVKMEEGKLLKLDDIPLETSQFTTHFSGAGRAIFVMDPSGNLYVGPQEVGLHHHSSFLSGGRVICAGEIETDSEGIIVYISNLSGHYRPSANALINFLGVLQESGFDLEDVAVHIGTPFGTFLDYRSADRLVSSPETPLPDTFTYRGLCFNFNTVSGKVRVCDKRFESGFSLVPTGDAAALIARRTEQKVHDLILKSLAESGIKIDHLEIQNQYGVVISSASEYSKFLKVKGTKGVEYDAASFRANSLARKELWQKAIKMAAKVRMKEREGLDVVTMNPTTWSEAILKGDEDAQDEYYETLKDVARVRSVGTSVTRGHTPLELIENIHYLSDADRETFKMTIGRDGLLYQSGTLFNPAAECCFVLGVDNQLYIGPLIKGDPASGNKSFSHSSFFSGSPVKCAGTIPIGGLVEGKLLLFSNFSDSYGRKPSIRHGIPTFVNGKKEMDRLYSALEKSRIPNLDRIVIQDEEVGSGNYRQYLSKYVGSYRKAKALDHFHLCTPEAAAHRLRVKGAIGSYIISPGKDSDLVITTRIGLSHIDIIKANFTSSDKIFIQGAPAWCQRILVSDILSMVEAIYPRVRGKVAEFSKTYPSRYGGADLAEDTPDRVGDPHASPMSVGASRDSGRDSLSSMSISPELGMGPSPTPLVAASPDPDSTGYDDLSADFIQGTPVVAALADRNAGYDEVDFELTMATPAPASVDSDLEYDTLGDSNAVISGVSQATLPLGSVDAGDLEDASESDLELESFLDSDSDEDSDDAF